MGFPPPDVGLVDGEDAVGFSVCGAFVVGFPVLGLPEGLEEGALLVSTFVGASDGCCVLDGLKVGLLVGEDVGVPDGDFDGPKVGLDVFLKVGAVVGRGLGLSVGLLVGPRDGPLVGSPVGPTDGDLLGIPVGAWLGPIDGLLVGDLEGPLVLGLDVFVAVGLAEGPFEVGPRVGFRDESTVGRRVGVKVGARDGAREG